MTFSIIVNESLSHALFVNLSNLQSCEPRIVQGAQCEM